MNNSEKLKLIQDLIEQAENLTEDNLNMINQKAEMILRRIFGENNLYIKKLINISYHPWFFPNTLEDQLKSFNRGKNSLLDLLNVIKQDIELDDSINTSLRAETTIQNNKSNNIFIVHGHNEQMKESTARTIEKLKLNPIILHEQPNKGKTIIEKFTEYSNTSFAVVLLSADDIAYSKNDKKNYRKLRARQNVIFELGYFIGKLGRDRVLALYEVNPDFEIPSDYSGVLFLKFDKDGHWRFELIKELNAIGINVDANDIL